MSRIQHINIVRTAPVTPQPVCFDLHPPGRWAWAPLPPSVPITDMVRGGNAICSWWAYDAPKNRREQDWECRLPVRYCPIARPANAKVRVYRGEHSGQWMWEVTWRESNVERHARTGSAVNGAKRIYLASSWRNEAQQSLVQELRKAGHEVYDFKNPAPNNNGFSWTQIDPDYKAWTPEQFRAALDHPVSQLGFAHDYGAMQWADTFVLALPCGKSAHLELGWALGRGIPSYVLMAEKDEPELMYLLGANIVTSHEELFSVLSRGCRPSL